jgi:hypothetical protein
VIDLRIDPSHICPEYESINHLDQQTILFREGEHKRHGI